LAAGGAMAGVDAVLSGRARHSFSVIRPGGHHASQARGMGFCIFNSVAIAVRHGQAKYGLERVLIIDWDVHHGNGTQDIFYEDGTVFFFDVHQSDWFPHTGDASERGRGPGRDCTLNCPFPAGTRGKRIVDAVARKLPEAAERFNPGLIMISAGFDARVGDPLGRLCVEDEDFAELTRIVKDVARAYTGGRIVSILEGGYNIEGLASAATAHVRALMEE
jgi:acetoin utilization deacetylase AcuC-like enzyme